MFDPTIGNSRPDSGPTFTRGPDPLGAGAQAAAHGPALDAWCDHPQLADVLALARALPQATIVMCHVGRVRGFGAHGRQAGTPRL